LTDLLNHRADRPHYLPEILKHALEYGNALAKRTNGPVTVGSNAAMRLPDDGRANRFGRCHSTVRSWRKADGLLWNAKPGKCPNEPYLPAAQTVGQTPFPPGLHPKPGFNMNAAQRIKNANLSRRVFPENGVLTFGHWYALLSALFAALSSI
jgi:hypothetical protein